MAPFQIKFFFLMCTCTLLIANNVFLLGFLVWLLELHTAFSIPKDMYITQTWCIHFSRLIHFYKFRVAIDFILINIINIIYSNGKHHHITILLGELHLNQMFYCFACLYMLLHALRNIVYRCGKIHALRMLILIAHVFRMLGTFSTEGNCDLR